MVSWWIIGLALYVVLGTALISSAFTLLKDDKDPSLTMVGPFVTAVIFILFVAVWPLALVWGLLVSAPYKTRNR